MSDNYKLYYYGNNGAYVTSTTNAKDTCSRYESRLPTCGDFITTDSDHSLPVNYGPYTYIQDHLSTNCYKRTCMGKDDYKKKFKDIKWCGILGCYDEKYNQHESNCFKDKDTDVESTQCPIGYEIDIQGNDTRDIRGIELVDRDFSFNTNNDCYLRRCKKTVVVEPVTPISSTIPIPLTSAQKTAQYQKQSEQSKANIEASIQKILDLQTTIYGEIYYMDVAGYTISNQQKFCSDDAQTYELQLKQMKAEWKKTLQECTDLVKNEYTNITTNCTKIITEGDLSVILFSTSSVNDKSTSIQDVEIEILTSQIDSDIIKMWAYRKTLQLIFDEISEANIANKQCDLQKAQRTKKIIIGSSISVGIVLFLIIVYIIIQKLKKVESEIPKSEVQKAEEQKNKEIGLTNND